MSVRSVASRQSIWFTGALHTNAHNDSFGRSIQTARFLSPSDKTQKSGRSLGTTALLRYKNVFDLSSDQVQNQNCCHEDEGDPLGDPCQLCIPSVLFVVGQEGVAAAAEGARYAGILAGLEQNHADQEQAGNEDDDGQNQLCSRHRSILPFKLFKNRSGRGNVIHSDIFMILAQASEKCKGIFPALPVNSQLLPLVHLVFHRKIWYNKKPKCHIIPFIF